MATPKKSKVASDDAAIDALVNQFKSHRHVFENLAEAVASELQRTPALKPLIHSIRYRTKDPEHLRDKLLRKRADALEGGEPFDVTPVNLFEKLTDLAGVRLIHLHTSQFPRIDNAIRSVLDEAKYLITEGPIANTWDSEYRDLFTGWGAIPIERESMYTSVHYILDPQRKTPVRCELQVRTLMEEVWGEVSHTVNYPHKTTNAIVKEQLKVLARFTSGCTRLVDTIFIE